MLILMDYSHVNQTLTKSGYARVGIHSLNFDRYIPKGGRTQDNPNAVWTGAGSKEWLKHCEQVGKAVCEEMERMMDVLSQKYSIYQRDPNVKYGEHELFFYSNKGRNGKNWYDYIQLSFNDALGTDKNDQLLNDLLDLLFDIESENIACHVQYETMPYYEKLSTDAARKYDFIKDRFVSYRGIIGKVKVIEESGGEKRYGFFRKGAKKYYIPLFDGDLIFGIKECS